MKTSIKFFWLIASFFILVLILLASYFLVKKNQDIRKKAANNVCFSLPEQLNVQEQDEFDLPFMINTDGRKVIGLDVVVKFDQQYLRLIDIIPRSQQTSLKTYLPVADSGDFDKQKVLSEAADSGRISFGAVSFSWQDEQNLSPTVTTSPVVVALLRFKALDLNEQTSTSINFDFEPGSTTDSNMVSEENDDILSQVINLDQLIIEPKSIPVDPAEFSLKFKLQSINQKRMDKTINLVFKKNGQVIKQKADLAVSADEDGVYNSQIISLDPGIYDVYVKPWAHLGRKFARVELIEGKNEKDWTHKEFLAGDVNEDNLINIQDFSLLAQNYLIRGDE